MVAPWPPGAARPLLLALAAAAAAAPGAGAIQLDIRGAFKATSGSGSDLALQANRTLQTINLTSHRRQVSGRDIPETIAWVLNETTRNSSLQDDGPSGWGPPVWRRPGNNHKTARDAWDHFWEIAGRKLAALIIATVVLLVLDYKVVQEQIRKPLQPIFWVVCAEFFLLFVWLLYGYKEAAEWLEGYIYEWVFQADNMLVVLMIFGRYKVPRRLVDKTLMLLLCGQLTIRMLFYLGLAHLVQRVVAVPYIVGTILIYGGYATIRENGSEPQAAEPPEEPSKHGSPAEAAASSHDDLLLIAPALFCAIFTDLVLGADCAIAKIEEIDGTFWNLSSSAAALFALRASYFVLEELVNSLAYLQTGIGAVLMFIGLELLLMHWITLGSFASLSVVLVILGVAAVASLLRPRCHDIKGANGSEEPKEASHGGSRDDAKVPQGDAR